jgi:acetylglutamate synthase
MIAIKSFKTLAPAYLKTVQNKIDSVAALGAGPSPLIPTKPTDEHFEIDVIESITEINEAVGLDMKIKKQPPTKVTSVLNGSGEKVHASKTAKVKKSQAIFEKLARAFVTRNK